MVFFPRQIQWTGSLTLACRIYIRLIVIIITWVSLIKCSIHTVMKKTLLDLSEDSQLPFYAQHQYATSLTLF